MTKVIFIATLSLLTALRAAGVPVTPATPPSAADLNRLDKVEFPAFSGSATVEELTPRGEDSPFPAADQTQRAAVLSSTSI